MWLVLSVQLFCNMGFFHKCKKDTFLIKVHPKFQEEFLRVQSEASEKKGGSRRGKNKQTQRKEETKKTQKQCQSTVTVKRVAQKNML